VRDYERQLNRDAKWRMFEDPGSPKGCVEIGGVQVFVYFDNGWLRISPHYDTADPEVMTPEETVPTRVSGGDGSIVYEER
jgi:hypothetical protein